MLCANPRLPSATIDGAVDRRAILPRAGSAAIAVCLVALAGSLSETSLATAEDKAVITGPLTIIDGDTVELGVVRIRLHGIDAPETGQRCRQANRQGSWDCGKAATNRLAELMDRAAIRCHAHDRDRYGRIIAVCYAGERDVNAVLVEEGLAWAFRHYSEDYVKHEERARATGVGIWQGPAEPPWDYRANRWARAAALSPKPGCPIKGNIDRQGQKIYHTPWSPWYGRTRIDESKGQRWFCDEAEALAVRPVFRPTLETITCCAVALGQLDAAREWVTRMKELGGPESHFIAPLKSNYPEYDARITRMRNEVG